MSPDPDIIVAVQFDDGQRVDFPNYWGDPLTISDQYKVKQIIVRRFGAPAASPGGDE